VDLFETPELKEIFEHLVNSPETAGSAIFLEQLTPEAQQAWNRVDNIESKYGTPNLDQTYTDALRKLQVRPLKRQLERLELRLKKIAAEEYDSLVRERHRLRREIQSHMPEERQKPRFPEKR
jgi:hypothetical protein